MATFAIAGCGVTLGERPIEINECPIIADTIFPCPVLPDDMPLETIEAMQGTYLRTVAAYLDCRDAVDGYREILMRVRTE